MEKLLRQYFNDDRFVYIAPDHADLQYHTGMANESNGDFFQLYLRLKKDRIVDAKYNVSGCPFMIAIAALYVETIQDKTLLQAAEIQDFNIEKTLELPINKKDRLFLLEDALKNCIKHINRG